MGKDKKITEIPMQKVVWIDEEPYFPLQAVAWMTGNRVEEVLKIITEFNIGEYTVAAPPYSKQVPCVSVVGCLLIAMSSKSEKAFEFKKSLAEYIWTLNYEDHLTENPKDLLFELICGYRINKTDRTDEERSEVTHG